MLCKLNFSYFCFKMFYFHSFMKQKLFYLILDEISYVYYAVIDCTLYLLKHARLIIIKYEFINVFF